MSHSNISRKRDTLRLSSAFLQHARAREFARALCVGATLLALPTSALAQAGPSTASKIYDPGSRVPLSEYKGKSGNTVTLHVEPEILTWIAGQSGTVQVAVRSSLGSISYANATSVNTGNGEVKLTSLLLTGDCVAVTTLLKQNLTLVTNWDEALHSGRGGFSLGATGSIAGIDLDTTGTGTLVGAVGSGSTVSLDPNWDDAGGDYYYASDVYALFDEGTANHVNDVAPAYEVYVAENWAVAQPTPLAALWLSDRVRAMTGYPLAHRSGPDAFNSGAALGSHLQDDLPIFQAAHAQVIDPWDGTMDELSKSSLATFILPPGWTSQAAADEYPLLFNGQYDLYANGLFEWHPEGLEGMGQMVLRAIGECYNESDGENKVVGSFWNGGGAAATFTMHRSAYDNAAQLIENAATLLAVDPDRVVFMGGSRGGVTALEMGSNPYEYDYTALFIESYVPVVKMGSSIQYSTPSYPGGLESTPWVVGWKDAWQSTWVHPDTSQTGLEATMDVLFGTDDPGDIDDLYSIDSTPFRDGLIAQGTDVVIRYGTHDLFHSFEQVARYYDRLVEEGVDVQLDLYYRFGHAVPRDASPSTADLLDKVFDSGTVTTDLNHFKRSDPADATQYAPISPGHIPLVVETSISVGTGQDYTWSFVGEPGGRFRVRSARVGSDPNNIDPEPTNGEALAFSVYFSGVLDPIAGATSPAFGLDSYLFQGSGTTGAYWYVVEYSPDGDTNYEIVLGLEDVDPSPTGIYIGVAPPPLYDDGPIAYVGAVEEIGAQFDGRTGGLCEDDQF